MRLLGLCLAQPSTKAIRTEFLELRKVSISQAHRADFGALKLLVWRAAYLDFEFVSHGASS